MVDLRIDLIVAGQGIAKWPNLLGMENAWSTVGYFTQISNSQEVDKINGVIKKWVDQNTEKLSKAKVHFNAKTLGSIGFRANDFASAKSVNFPVTKENVIQSQDLRMSPKIARKITPISARKNPPQFGKESWNGFIDQQVTEEKST